MSPCAMCVCVPVAESGEAEEFCILLCFPSVGKLPYSSCRLQAPARWTTRQDGASVRVGARGGARDKELL